MRDASEHASSLAVSGLIAGLVGAKLLWMVEHLGEEPAFELLTSRGGLSWFGGLVGGVGVGLLVVAYRRWPVMPLLAAAAPAVAVGQMLGRVGCFLVGDDYGLPTRLPWGVAFPRGTSADERARAPHADLRGRLPRPARVAARALAPSGPARPRRCSPATACSREASASCSSFVRVNVRVAGGLTVAQYASLALIVAGLALLATSRRRRAQ